MGLSIINSIAPREHVDTYFADVKKLSSDSAAALEHSLLVMKHVEEQVMLVQSESRTGRGDAHAERHTTCRGSRANPTCHSALQRRSTARQDT